MAFFLRSCAHTAFLTQDLKLEAQNYPSHQIIAQSIQKQRNSEDFLFLAVATHQIMIMMSQYRIEDDVIKNFMKFQKIAYSYQVLPSSDLK